MAFIKVSIMSNNASVVVGTLNLITKASYDEFDGRTFFDFTPSVRYLLHFEVMLHYMTF